MCLALPALLVEKRPHDQALIDLGGIRKSISIALVPEANVGDYVIVHVGHAIGMLDLDEAQKTLSLFAELHNCEPDRIALADTQATAHATAAEQP